MKKIKYWKPILENVSLKDALKCLDSRCCNNLRYDRIGIRIGPKVIDQYDDYKNMNFNIKEVTSDLWEVVVPDINKEEVLYKCREMIKNEHFLRLTNDRIDNMNISDLFNVIFETFVSCDDNVKYRLIKHIVELKLYKK